MLLKIKGIMASLHPTIIVQIAGVNGDPPLPPRYGSKGASGGDLHYGGEETVYIKAGDRALLQTGIWISIPPGYEGQVRSRSGLANKNGVSVLNSPGTIDCDYTGEIMVILINLGKELFVVNPGDRIAQLVISPVVHATYQIVEILANTERGTGGLGSTGVSSQ